MERHHYPDARDMVERIRGIIEAQRQQLEKQLAAANEQNATLSAAMDEQQQRADIAESYIRKINSAGGNQ